MDLKNKTLEEWLVKPPKKSLKKGGDKTKYFSKYDTLKNELEKKHGETTKAAILQDIRDQIEKSKKNGRESFDLENVLWLNDHGPKHIETVINRATDLIDGSNIVLNAREIFVLLNAIQLHDIGNFYGRTGHEKKIFEVVNDMLPLVAFDDIEKIYIKNIAQVHGGKIIDENGNEDKNTIGTIKNSVVSVDGYEIHKHLLASILRFADELADDKSRADSSLLFENKIPHSSQIFHAFSFCLDTVLVKHELKTVELHFKIPKDFIFEKLGKKDTSVYILDEIYERVLKMHTERIYCSMFWKGLIEIDKIWVQIEFYPRHIPGVVLTEKDFNIHDDITFSLPADNKYPEISNDIFSMCDELKFPNGDNMTGENLYNKLRLKHEK